MPNRSFRLSRVLLVFSLALPLAIPLRVTGSTHTATEKKIMANTRTSARGTVVVGIAVAEGLVLVGDSRVTLQNSRWNPPYKVISDSHEKIAAVADIGLATFGTAFVLGRSVNSWIQDFTFELQKDGKYGKLTLDGFLSEFVSYFGPKVEEHRKQQPETSVGFLVAGYGNDGIGRIHVLVFPGGKPVEQKNTKDNVGMTWQGEKDTIQRIILGYDSGRLWSLDYFRSLDARTQKNIKDQLGQVEYAIYFQYLSLQDAIDLATFLVRATVTMQRFSFGTIGKPGSLPDVGGPIDSLVVTPAGLKWIRHKQISTE